MRLWGLLLIALSLLYLPGHISPLRNRYPNLMGVAIRLVLALSLRAVGARLAVPVTVIVTVWSGIPYITGLRRVLIEQRQTRSDATA
jgi:hypothetical protein